MTSPRPGTYTRLTDVVFDKVMKTIRTPDKSGPLYELLSDAMGRLDLELDQPLRISAETPSSTKLLIRSNRVKSGDGGERSVSPIEGFFQVYPETTINFTSGAIVGGTVTLLGSAFALPTVTTGQFVRMALVYKSEENAVDVAFSTAAASIGALQAPEVLLDQMKGLPLGYIELEAVVGGFKTPGAATSVIENFVGSVAFVHRFLASGSGGAGGLSIESKSANFTAEEAIHYLVDTTSGAVAVTLPAGEDGVRIRFSDSMATWQTNNLTINAGVGDQLIYGGVISDSLIADVPGTWFELMWDAVLGYWIVDSAFYPESNDVQLAVDGSALAPAFAFASDTDTGFYRKSSGSIGLASNGVEGFSFTDGSMSLGSEIAGYSSLSTKYIGNIFNSLLVPTSGLNLSGIRLYTGAYFDGVTVKRTNANQTASRLLLNTSTSASSNVFQIQADPSVSHAADSTAAFVNVMSISADGATTIGNAITPTAVTHTLYTTDTVWARSTANAAPAGIHLEPDYGDNSSIYILNATNATLGMGWRMRANTGVGDHVTLNFQNADTPAASLSALSFTTKGSVDYLGAWSFGVIANDSTHTFNGATVAINRAGAATLLFQNSGSQIASVQAPTTGGLNFRGTTSTLFGGYDNTGAFTLGSAGFSGSHIFNAGLVSLVSPATTISVATRWSAGATLNGYMGVEGSPGNILITGSAANTLCIVGRVGVNISADNGSTTQLGVATSGAVTVGPATGTVVHRINRRYAIQTEDNVSATTPVNSLAHATSALRMTAGAAITINGIAAGSDGEILYICNQTGTTLTFNHNSASAVDADKIFTSDGSAKTVLSQQTIHFIYMGARWRLMT